MEGENRDIKQDIKEIRRNHTDLHQTVFDLVTEVAVLKKTIYGNGRKGVAQVLESLETVTNNMQLNMTTMQGMLNNNKDVFNNKLKMTGLWIAGIGLIINGAVGIIRLIMMAST